MRLIFRDTVLISVFNFKKKKERKTKIKELRTDNFAYGS